MQKAVFLHIPKTAGTTLSYIISRNYRTEEMAEFYEPLQQKTQLSAALENPEVKIAYGHFDFGEMPSTPNIYSFTFLREPIDRVISNYLHIKYSSYPQHVEWLKNGNTLPDFLRLPQGKNWQTRLFAGQKFGNDLDDETMLCTALANLQKVNFAGISEHFEKSLCIISLDLGWKKLGHGPQNVGSRKEEFRNLKEHFGTEIAAANALDAKLYKVAKEAIEERMEKISILQKLRCRMRKFR